MEHGKIVCIYTHIHYIYIYIEREIHYALFLKHEIRAISKATHEPQNIVDYTGRAAPPKFAKKTMMFKENTRTPAGRPCHMLLAYGEQSATNVAESTQPQKTAGTTSKGPTNKLRPSEPIPQHIVANSPNSSNQHP